MSRLLVVPRRSWLALLILFLLADSGRAAPALPGDPCQVEPRPVWSETEAWVWKQICVGEIADLNAHFGRDLDPRSGEGWTEERKLSSVFLETILLYDPWRNAIPRQGVRIGGAWFAEKVDLEGAEIFQQLWLVESRFVSDINLHQVRSASALALAGSFVNGNLGLSDARIEGQIYLIGAKIAGAIYMDEAEIGRSLLMHSGDRVAGRRAEFKEVYMRGAKVGGQVTLIGAKVAGTLDMESADIGQSLLMHSTPQQRAEFQDVVLLGAKIGGPVDLTGAKVAGAVDINVASIGGNLLMRDGAEFAQIGLRGTDIVGQLNLAGAKVSSTLNMDSAEIGQSLLMHSTPQHRAEFNDVVLRGAKIGGQVTFIGAKVAGTLDMDSADIGRTLFMRSDDGDAGQRAEFHDVILLVAKVGGHVDLAGAKVAGELNMDSAEVTQSLFMRSHPEQRAEFNHVRLVGATIGGQVDLAGANVAGELNMSSAEVGRTLFMLSNPGQRAEFNEVVLHGAKIGGQVDLTGAKVAAALDMRDANIRGTLSMRSTPEQRAEFGEVDLLAASIGGQVDLTGSKVTGVLDMNAARIGDSVFMRSDPEQRAEFGGGVDLVFARIGSNLDLRGAALSSLDLTGTMIEGELRLASPFRGLPTWADGGRLNLRNMTVDALQDEPGAWPAELDLDGFTYGRLGGFDINPSVDVAARGSEWFVDWLARDQPFTPQPYEQLAGVLREMGHGEEANDVLFAGRERARERAWDDGHWYSWTGQTLLKYTVGYGFGYRYFWALYWVLGLVLIATIILGVTGQNQRNDGKTIGMWYSLDMLLPIIKLREKHYDIDLDGCARYYFYFHKIMGYVLASFLIAGVAGLTE